jgi:hypothetical protein
MPEDINQKLNQIKQKINSEVPIYQNNFEPKNEPKNEPKIHQKPKNSNWLSKFVLLVTSLLVLASLGLIVNQFYLKPFGRIPDQSIFSGSLEQVGDLKIFRDPANQKYCIENGTIKPADCEDRPQYIYYKAGQFTQGNFNGYTRIIVHTKNYPTDPVIFATKDNTKYILNGGEKLNEQIAKLNAPESKIDGSKIEKISPIPDSMIPIIDFDNKFSLTRFQSIEQLPFQRISLIQKNLGSEKRKLADGNVVDVTKFEYSIGESKNLNELSGIKGSNSKVYQDLANKRGLYQNSNNQVIVTDSTGLGYDYYLQFKDKLDIFIQNSGEYFSERKEITDYIKGLTEKLISEGRDPKQPETQELLKKELAAKFPDFVNLNTKCPVQFGVYKDQITTSVSLFNVYGSNTTPYTKPRGGVAPCYGEYTRFGVGGKFNESEYTQVAATNTGYNLYTPKVDSPNYKLIREHFVNQINVNKDVQNNSDKSVFENFNPNIVRPDEVDYNAKNPILVTPDPFGRAIILGETDYYGIN